MSKYARATFKGFNTGVGQMLMRMPNLEVEIEVFRATHNTWKARTLSTKVEHAGISGPPEYVMEAISKRFDSQLTLWRWVDSISGDEVESPIDPDNSSRHIVSNSGPRVGHTLDPKHRQTLCGKVVHISRVTADAAGSNCDNCRSIKLEETGIRKKRG